MVNRRPFLPPNSQSTHVFIRGRLYSTTASPSAVLVCTRAASSNPQDVRFPLVEGAFQHACLQPYIHDLDVDIKHGRQSSSFRIFLKRHKRMPANFSAPALGGDVLIMRVARDKKGVVNLRSADGALVDYLFRSVTANLALFQEKGPRALRAGRIAAIVKGRGRK